MQDQLIIYMALAAGTSRMLCTLPTLHTETAMVIAEKLLPSARFTVGQPVGACGGPAPELRLVQCHGAAVLPEPPQ